MSPATIADLILILGCLGVAAWIWVKENPSLKELLVYLGIAIITFSAISNVYHH